MAEAFRGKNVTRHSAEEISKALGVGVDQAFRFESTETALAGKTLREYALFARQVLQFASDHYGTVQPAFALPEKRSRPRFVDCLHEDEVKTLLNYLPNCNMTEQAIQIVSNDDFVACIQQFHSGMAADIAGATGNKDIHNLYLPIYIADEAVKSCLAIHISLIDTSMLQYLGKHLANFQLQNACGIVRCKRMGFL